MNKPQIFHGEWWIPAEADPDNLVSYMVGMIPNVPKGGETKNPGTLTYNESEDSFLELYHVPSEFHGKHYLNNRVMWGVDANGNIFTLFGVTSKGIEIHDFTKIEYKVQLILLGIHVLSLDDKIFDRCVIEFPYLRNWAFHSNLTYKEVEGVKHITYADITKGKYLVDAEIEDGIKWLLMDGYKINRGLYDLFIDQKTLFNIEASVGLSIRNSINQIIEFSQFLSIALYCKQRPTAIRFYGKDNDKGFKLLFKIDKSIDPGISSLIKFDKLKEKVPLMLIKWHQNYDNISPISNYLIDSLHRGSPFDVPDFLIIAEALDGYHKRFVNKRDGKNIKKYEDQIKALLKIFKDVDAIKRCNIITEVLKDSRHKYSHLYPDDEKSSAVQGRDLYWLTEKCKILLTCCILDMSGLTNEEINICCNDSPIQYIIDSHPFEFE